MIITQRMAVIPNECEESNLSDESPAPKQESMRSVEIPRYPLLRNSPVSGTRFPKHRGWVSFQCNGDSVAVTCS